MEINLNNKLNELLSLIDKNNKPNLFLHVCCGPCSTQVLQKLYEYFNIYIIFYNPNIDTEEEFTRRLNEFHKVIDINNYKLNILYEDYNHNEYLDKVKGYELEPEGKTRCHICYELRLKTSFDIATKYIINNNQNDKENYLCTTLSISPYKNAELLYTIGKSICENSKYLKYLPSDFKKEDGYLKSIELSRKYGLYRQDYCGCEFAKCHDNMI